MVLKEIMGHESRLLDNNRLFRYLWVVLPLTKQSLSTGFHTIEICPASQYNDLWFLRQS